MKQLYYSRRYVVHDSRMAIWRVYYQHGQTSIRSFSHTLFSGNIVLAEGIPFETVEKSIKHSLNFGVYKEGKQVGFARVITDYATYAYIGDVYILEDYRGQGLSKWLMQVITDHPELQGLRRWTLITRDAHELYRKTGFTEPQNPERYMEKTIPDVYKNGEV
jgi:GNAT superfamily N-acetyltransferase